MKKRVPQILIALCLAMTIMGCHGVKEQEVLKNVRYSNLKESAVQDTLRDIMKDANISSQRQETFFNYVNKFNEAVSEDELTEGYEEADNTAIHNEKELQKFKVFFSTIPTKNTKDITEHVKQLQKDWKERGISFDEEASPKLITVLFHESIDESENYLFIGHTGILIPHEEELFFIEKLAFQEPYRLVIFKNRTELNDYLMTKYDISVGQPTAKPFIMENDQLMEGYRQLSNKSK